MNQEKQPMALRLADWCDANSSGAYRPSADAADELRRQHFALVEWFEKTQWVQKTVKPRELGMHRADILRARIDDLEAQLSAIGAGGVESLRKRDGQQPQAWLVYLPSCDAQNVYDSRDDAGYIDDLTNNDDAVVTPLYAALQAAPSAPAAVAVPDGYALVPMASTAAMEWAFRRADVTYRDGAGQRQPMDPHSEFQARYRNMLTAIPAQEHATQLAGQGQWTDLGYTSAAHYAEDMQAVGEALMEAVKDNYASLQAAGWRPSDSPAEIVVDLLNLLDQANAAAPAQAHKDEQA